MLVVMDTRPVTVADLRAELALYPDDAVVVVLTPDGATTMRSLHVVSVGYGDVAPDAALEGSVPLVTEPLPHL